MPELPEVETVNRTLQSVLPGRRILGFELFWHRTIEPWDAEAFRSRVLGQRIIEVGRRGKLVILLLETGYRITVHLRMTGELLYQPAATASVSEQRLPYLRARFELDNGDQLLFFDTRKFGRIRLVDSPGWEQLNRELGIEPLSPEFTAGKLERILRSHRRQIKPLLLDQTVIAGLGNIYVDETLFRAKVHPLQVSNALGTDEIDCLHHAIVETLAGAVEYRGTTLRDYRSGLGEPGQNRSRLLVYGTKPGSPCPRCETPLTRLSVGQRGTILCPSCQQVRLKPNSTCR